VLAIVEICSTQPPKVPLPHLLASFSRDEVEVDRERERDIYIYLSLYLCCVGMVGEYEVGMGMVWGWYVDGMGMV
jgi:hypothetical protein